MTVRRKILLSLVAFSFIPVLVLSALWISNDEKILKTIYTDRMRAVAQAAASSVNETVSFTKEHVNLLATSWNMRDYINVTSDENQTRDAKLIAAGVLRDNFLRYIDTAPLLDDVVLLDGMGQVALACDTQITGRDLSAMDYFLAHLNGDKQDDYVFNGTVHDSLTDPENAGKRSVAFSRAIRSDDGGLRCILVVFANAELLGRSVSNVTFGETGIAYVIDSNNYILHQPDPGFVNNYTVSSGVNNLIERYDSGDIPRSGLLEDVLNGVPRLIFYEIIPEINMTLILRQDLDDLRGENMTELRLTVAFSLAALAVSVLFGILFSKKLARPFTWLYGLFNPNVKNGGDELSGIMDGYNEMQSRLEKQDEMLKLERERSEYSANRDPLTDLLNRTAFEREFKHRLKNPPAVMIFLDIGRFRQINDTYGHIAGDGVLIETGRRLVNSAAGFEMVGRAGGGQFMLAKWAGQEDAERALQIVVEEFKQPFTTGTYRLNIAVYLGAAVYPDDGTTVDMLMGGADIAMRAAKETKHSSFMFYGTQMRERLSRSNLMADVLISSIDEGELFLMYQPFYGTDNSIIGFEAFMRIRNRRLGLLSPKDFIPVAEAEPELISRLGMWVITEALRFLKRASDRRGFTGFVSVNISAKQLSDPEFAENISNALNEMGIPANRLQLEIAVIREEDDAEKYASVLNELSKRGILIALDNFGGASSSMYYVTHLPIDLIKVDQPFYSRMGGDKRAAQINKGFLETLRRLGIKASAKRVETESDFTLLKSVGYETIQGFYLSLPLLEESAVEIIEKKL